MLRSSQSEPDLAPVTKRLSTLTFYWGVGGRDGGDTRAEWALFFLATPVTCLAADVSHVRAIKEIRALWGGIVRFRFSDDSAVSTA